MNATFIKPQWSPLTIALMVLGFVIFWPLGLAMLAYILWGEMFGGTSEKAEAWINQKRAWCQDRGNRHASYGAWSRGPSTGNAAFDEYRAEQLRRLDEERRKLDEERREFEAFVHNLRRARDQEEFDRFMRDRQNRPRNSGDTIDL